MASKNRYKHGEWIRKEICDYAEYCEKGDDEEQFLDEIFFSACGKVHISLLLIF